MECTEWSPPSHLTYCEKCAEAVHPRCTSYVTKNARLLCVTCHEKVVRQGYKTSESEDTGDKSDKDQKRATKKGEGQEK